jgi:endoglucanase
LEANRKLGRGVNVLGFDPFWRTNGTPRFQQKYFRMLKEAGFDSIRVNLYGFRPMKPMNPTNNFHLPDSWFRKVDWIVDNATTNGLVVILDLHEFNAMADDPAKNRDKFLAFWRQVAERYEHAPNTVLFELLNEPSKKLTPELWNAYLKDGLRIVREKNPMRPVIIGPGFWNSVEHVDELELPEDDRNLILTVHYYVPFEFTHQGASWSNQRDKSGIEWRGTDPEVKRIRSDLQAVSAWAKAHNRPVFLGEFGAYDKADMPSRAKYLGAVAREAEAQGWSWAYWQFDSDFILYDVKTDKWVEPIREALLVR